MSISKHKAISILTGTMNGIFAIEKPSGITSNQFMMKIQHLFNGSEIFSKEIKKAVDERVEQLKKETGKVPPKRKLRKISKVKMGHGGTLDPLASGVMVIGVGNGTKKLSDYLQGTVKIYESEALFGVSTTSGDSEGDILSRNSVKHLNMEDLSTVKEKFEGSLKQTPPIYAALKMNGKPLHEYARKGIPLPKAIEPRQCNIFELDVFSDSLSKNHKYPILRNFNQVNKEIVKDLNANMLLDTLYYSKEYCESHNLTTEIANIDKPIEITEEENNEIMEKGDLYRAPLLHIKAKVSSGTYIRSLISDIGKSMKTSCYMVKLIRLQQKDWSLMDGNVFKFEDFTENDEKVWSQVLSLVFEKGTEINIQEEINKAKERLANEENDTPVDNKLEDNTLNEVVNSEEKCDNQIADNDKEKENNKRSFDQV